MLCMIRVVSFDRVGFRGWGIALKCANPVVGIDWDPKQDAKSKVVSFSHIWLHGQHVLGSLLGP